MDFFFLSILSIIGLVVSYEDIKMGKVRNKLILMGFIAGLLGYLLLITAALFSSKVDFIYFKKVLINICISWAISFFIWYVGLWPAGDAKLFILFSFLIPLKYYGDNLPIHSFPSFGLFVNIFISVLIFILPNILFRIILIPFNFILNFKKHREVLIDKFLEWIKKINENKSTYMQLLLVYFFVFQWFYLFRLYLSKEIIRTPIILEKFSYIAIILVYWPLRFFLKTKKIRAVTLLLIALLFMHVAFTVGISFKGYLLALPKIFMNFSGFMVVFGFAKKIIELYIQKNEIVKLSIDKISSHMLLTKESIKKIDEFFKKEGLTGKFYSDGLTSRQVNYLKELSLKKNNLQEVEVYRTFPFAPFIFVGAIVTILARGIIFNHFLSFQH